MPLADRYLWVPGYQKGLMCGKSIALGVAFRFVTGRGLNNTFLAPLTMLDCFSSFFLYMCRVRSLLRQFALYLQFIIILESTFPCSVIATGLPPSIVTLRCSEKVRSLRQSMKGCKRPPQQDACRPLKIKCLKCFPQDGNICFLVANDHSAILRRIKRFCQSCDYLEQAIRWQDILFD